MYEILYGSYSSAVVMVMKCNLPYMCIMGSVSKVSKLIFYSVNSLLCTQLLF